MTPLDLALAAILGVSVLLSVIVLATLALILEAILFGLGHGGGDDKYDGR